MPGASAPGARSRVALTAIACLLTVSSIAVATSLTTATAFAAGSPLAAGLTVGAGVALVGGALLALWQRSAGSLGQVTLGIGLAWFAPVWVGWEAGPGWARSLAMIVAPYPPALLLHAAAGFPAGRVQGWGLRAAVAAGYVATTVYAGLRALLRDPYRDALCWSNCSDNSFLLVALPQVARFLDTAWPMATIALSAATLMVAARRLAHESPTGRRQAWPALVPTALAASAVALGAAHQIANPVENPRSPLAMGLYLTQAACLLGLGLGVARIVVQEWRTRQAVGRLSADLAGAPEPGTLPSLLAVGIGDPGLTVAYWVPGEEALVDPDGHPARSAAAGQATTTLVREGRPLAVIRHDPALAVGSHLADQLGPAARLALDNERMRAVLLARVETVKASRSRIVETSDVQRRQLERDLHDGAQQRMVALTLELRMALADARAAADRTSIDAIGDALDEAEAALGELREIAHGIYPAILAESGLRPALDQVADRADVPVYVEETPSRRCSRAAEQAVYLLVRSAVRSAASDPGAELSVRVTLAGEQLTAHVTPLIGTIDREVADRVGALGGAITESAGSVRMEVPCG